MSDNRRVPSIVEVTTDPSTPSAGKVKLFAKAKALWQKDSDGLAVPLIKKRQTFTLTSDVIVIHAAHNLIIEGSFVPAFTYMDVYVDFHGTLDGQALMGCTFTYGVPDGAGRLRSGSHYAPVIAGAVEAWVSHCSGGRGGSVPQSSPVPYIRISSLTPGTTYKFQLTGGILSGSDDGLLGVSGQYVDEGTKIVVLPNGTKVYTVFQGSNVVQVMEAPWQPDSAYSGLGLDRPESLADASRREIIMPASMGAIVWPNTPSASPDSGRVIIPQIYGDGTLGPLCPIIETVNDTVERTVNPGSFTAYANGYYAAKFLDNTYAYLSSTYGRVYKVNVTTGATSATIVVDAGVILNAMELDATGTYLYVVGYNNSKLYRIKVSDNTVTTQTLNATAQVIKTLGIGSDGRIYLGLANGSIEVRNSDLTYNSTIAAPTSAASSAVNCIRPTADRKMLLVAFNNGTYGWMYVDGAVVPPFSYHDTPTGFPTITWTDIGPEEQMYLYLSGATAATSRMFMWQGAKVSFRCNPSNPMYSFWSEHVRVHLDGVA